MKTQIIHLAELGNNKTLEEYENLQFLPRIGEEVLFDNFLYNVTKIVYNFDCNNIMIYVELHK